MIRSLIIRQIFFIIEIALVIMIMITGVMVIRLVVNKNPAVERFALAITTEVNSDVVPYSLREISNRELYTGIIRNGLFGPAGRWNPDEVPVEPPPPPPPPPTVEETTLRLRLLGTVALHPDDPFGMAIIENLDERGNVRSYALGDSVVEDVSLAEVHKRRVILVNNRVSPSRHERLSMDDADADIVQVVAGGQTGAVRAERQATDRIELSRNELVDELYNSYNDLIRLEPELVTDDNGEVIGVTASGFEDIPLAQQLGLSEGDILQTVNNIKIDSQEKIMEIVQNQQNATSFRIGIMRNGQTQVITYTMR